MKSWKIPVVFAVTATKPGRFYYGPVNRKAQDLQNCIRISKDNVLIRNAIGSEPKAFHGYDPSH